MTLPKALKDQLAKIEVTPLLAIEQGWYKDHNFCLAFFDRCEQRILEKAPGALTMAHRAAEFAERSGDRHLRNLSRGVIVHAFIADGLLFWARDTVDSYRESALACCSRCKADFYFRDGDLLGEMGFSWQAIRSLDKCLKFAGDDVKPDYLGRVCYLRAVAHHVQGNRVQALDDAGAALRHLSLESPRGFFLDTIAFIAVFLGGDDPSDDELAWAQLAEFRERIKGESRWSEARARLCWVEGQVLARLGDFRRAREHLEQAVSKIVPHGLAREVVAVILDACQLRLRHQEPNKTDIGVARRLLNSCLERRADLPPKHNKALKDLAKLLKSKPETLFHVIGELRASFVAPVPNRFEERVRPELGAREFRLTPGHSEIFATGGGRVVR